MIVYPFFYKNSMEEEEEHSDHEDLEEGAKKDEKEEKEDHKNLNHHSLYYNFTQRYFTTYRTPTQYLQCHSNGYTSSSPSLFLVRVRTDTLPSPAVGIIPVLQFQQVKGKKKSKPALTKEEEPE